jgi:hypothetical protein
MKSVLGCIAIITLWLALDAPLTQGQVLAAKPGCAARCDAWCAKNAKIKTPAACSAWCQANRCG